MFELKNTFTPADYLDAPVQTRSGTRLNSTDLLAVWQVLTTVPPVCISLDAKWSYSVSQWTQWTQD